MQGQLLLSAGGDGQDARGLPARTQLHLHHGLVGCRHDFPTPVPRLASAWHTLALRERQLLERWAWETGWGRSVLELKRRLGGTGRTQSSGHRGRPVEKEPAPQSLNGPKVGTVLGQQGSEVMALIA